MARKGNRGGGLYGLLPGSETDDKDEGEAMKQEIWKSVGVESGAVLARMVASAGVIAAALLRWNVEDTARNRKLIAIGIEIGRKSMKREIRAMVEAGTIRRVRA